MDHRSVPSVEREFERGVSILDAGEKYRQVSMSKRRKDANLVADVSLS